MGSDRLHSPLVTRKTANLKTVHEIPAIPRQQNTEKIPITRANDPLGWANLLIKNSDVVLCLENSGVWYVVLGLDNTLDPQFVDVKVKDFAGNVGRVIVPRNVKFHLFLGEVKR